MSEIKSPPDGSEVRRRPPRKELTIHLFHVFMVSISESDRFAWLPFIERLEYEAVRESLRLAEGNGRAASSLLNIKYKTFMKRAYKYGLLGRVSKEPETAAGGATRAEADPSEKGSQKND